MAINLDEPLMKIAGPLAIAIVGAIISFILKTLHKSFLKLLERNENDHKQFEEMLVEHGLLINTNRMRNEKISEKHGELSEHEKIQDDKLTEHGERIAKVESKVEGL